jgi:hypothetical protein
LGIGCSTPDETTVMTRPQPLSRIGGSSWRVSSKMPMAMAWYELRQAAASTCRIDPVGGPPVLLTRMSTPPASSSRCASPFTDASSARSTISARARGVLMAAATSASRSRLRAARTTSAPSAASAVAMARPSPRLAPSTRARLPAMPRSISPAP